jgi:predicted CXXCH cytochrome family protein
VKKLLTTAGALALTFAFATAASAQITGSAHDFVGDAWNTGGEMCAVCHTPHNASAAVSAAVAPLWDHEVSAATYTTYGAGYDMQSTVYNINGTSQLCLSCHDGTVALENFGGVTTGTALMGTVNAAADLTNDLSDDHPVGMAYDPVGDTELHPTTNTFGTVTVADVLGTGSTVECSSCHDVHNAGFASLLRIDNAGSTLCLACHNK